MASTARSAPSPRATVRRLDRLPARLTIVLLTVGLVMVYSASSATRVLEGLDPAGLVTKQAIAGAVGLAAFALAARMRPDAIHRLARPLVLIALVTLAAVAVPGIGVYANGARRWLNLGVTQFQPSELAKVALVLWTADMLSRRPGRRPEIRPPLLAAGLVILLVVAEPDLGTALVMALTIVTMCFLAGAHRRQIVRLLGSGAAAVAVLILTVPYMRHRLLGFVDPWSKARGAGFQTVHAEMAIGSGGWFGVGPGRGIQKISYLPESHTDMIAATIGEEFGILGFLALVALFALFAIAGYRIAAAARRPVDRLVAGGLTTLVTVQAAINLGAVLGLLPITGVPLPFISYGGTSLVVFLAASGILVNIARSASAVAVERPERRPSPQPSGDRRGRDGGARDAGARGRRRAAAAWR